MSSRCPSEGPPNEGGPRIPASGAPAAATAPAAAAATTPPATPVAAAAAAAASRLSCLGRSSSDAPSSVGGAPQGAPNANYRSQGTETGGPPMGPPSASRSQGGEFELPLLLLQSSTDGRAPRGGGPQGAPNTDEDWQAEVSASVAAAFRDLRGSMFLGSSSNNSSRSSRLGLGDALFLGGGPPRSRRTSRGAAEGPLGGGAPRGAPRGAPESLSPSAASHSTEDSSCLTPSENTSSRQQTPRGPLGVQERVLPPDTPTSEEGGPPGGPHLCGGPLTGVENDRGGGPGYRESRGLQPEAAEKDREGGPSPHAGAPETAADIQTEFLAAYTIPQQQVAAAAETVEATDTAAATADTPVAAAAAAAAAAAPEAEGAAAGPQIGGTTAAAAAAASAAAAAAAATATDIPSSCCTPHSEPAAKEGPPQDLQGPPTPASRGPLGMRRSPAPSPPPNPKP
ncbi:uncharacterized protein EMH_0017060 [Eimeria mitis]|uniref:Uncharacterized protein n=1 Tax=Eimeria mitis TaxID=44415 RepID=U6KDW9_9EIME|nr:uncharacterized protein EMH_0017060 [Eimeria mitis]CDJ33678.1 hypothetical protein, conserved [Eimeria mitis]